MKVKIFQPAKSAMQSGKKNRKKWLVEPIAPSNVRSINSLTGWVSAANTDSQLHFEFSSKEDAVAFAKKKGFEFEVFEPHISPVKLKSYAENFTS